MIVPTVGRVVQLYLNVQDHADGKPLAATIAYVHEDSIHLNIGFLHRSGEHSHITHVPLVQDKQPLPERGPFCTWMPYQLGQAAKTEAAIHDAEVAIRAAKTPRNPPL